MGLRIEGDRFYMLKTPEEKIIYVIEGEAIRALKDCMLSKDLKPEEISLLEISIIGEKWEIKQVPWSRIAFKLIKGEEDVQRSEVG